MSEVPVPVAGAMDDLDTIAAQFQEDVARIEIFVNGQAYEDYTTEDGRQVPTLSKVVANVEDMIAPDVATIMAGATAATQAASAAQASAASAAQDAQSSGASAELVESYAVTVAADAAAAHDSAERAEASKDAAGTARDTAVAAQANVQQNADTASTAASNAQASAADAAASAQTSSSNAAQTGLDVQAASQHAGNAAASAVAASGAEGRASASATAAAQSASASAASADLSAQHASAINPANFIQTIGGSMTGALWMNNSAAINLNSPSGHATLRADAGMPGCGFVNNGGTAWNIQIVDDGRIVLRNTLTIGAGGAVIQGQAGAAIGSGTIINWNESAGLGETVFINNNAGAPGGFTFRSVNANNTVQTMSVTFNSAGIINCGGVTATGNVSSGGLVMAAGNVHAGSGSSTLGPDGNVWGSVWGGWLSSWVINQVASRDGSINNAQNTANDAWNRANNAQSTADDALTGAVRRWTGNSFQLGWRGVLFFGVDGGEQATLIGVAVSDQTQKHSIRDIETGSDFRDSLALVNSLKFVSFDYTEQYCNGQHRDIGVIAQDCYASFKADDDVLYVDERTLLFDALHAIKELTARVRELEAKL